ncbi:unnamed protein product [Protopolystoma xenopodis]|uniref:Uncharacterized protein n=1 Tax=Protopolystoma xenopodis TaxID=117903 RepID=A0A448X3M5_9PLAT|nr:unnamed protein product [Protopolystoma xenopodis]
MNIDEYLGKDFVDISGHTLLESGTRVTMDQISRPGVTLVPGQIIPLMPCSEAEKGILQKLKEEKRSLLFLPDE